ncbi:MAG: enoyl-CoA hydratase [Rhodobacterales bacterium]|nr:MAG: enoyl-CoA hydratase [Rhodobacterales bacterium]
MYETIKTEVTGAVALIRLNRPKALNALNSTLLGELLDATRGFDRDPGVHVVVITGSERAFAAGADIAEMADLTADQVIERDMFRGWDEFTAVRIPKIAAVNGFALGGGCELVQMCDFAIAGEGAKFGQPEIKLGVIAGMGGTQRMTKLLGRALSMDLHLTGRMMGAAEAKAAGLVARVVPDDAVLSTAMEAAEQIAAYSPRVVRVARDMVMRAEEMSLAEGVHMERQMFHRLFGTRDQQEGMKAFLEKRSAKFD